MMISSDDKKALLSIALKSIEYPVKTGKKYKIDASLLSTNLQRNAAVFVTLYVKNELHGCVGSLKAFRSLAEDVSSHAFNAAFEDNRFTVIVASDLDHLRIEISILSEPVRMEFKNEADLLEKINMYDDGLIFKSGKKQATFLPSVWEILPNKVHFLERLKEKAGLPVDYWSDEIEFFKYHVEKIT